MSDWIGLGIFLAVAALAVVASSLLGRPRRRLSVEEFEERARSGAAARAGVFALQQLLDPKAAKAVAVQQDLRHGYYNKKRVPGDGDDDEEADGVDDGRAAEPSASSDSKGPGSITDQSSTVSNAERSSTGLIDHESSDEKGSV